MKKFSFLVGAILVASPTFSHDLVQNKVVKTRMLEMKKMASNLKALGAVSKGKRAFVKSEARGFARDIAAIAGQIPFLFQDEETDPHSKAKPEIWFNYKDFSLKAANLEKVAMDLSRTIFDLQDVKGGMREIGASCKLCHQHYKN